MTHVKMSTFIVSNYDLVKKIKSFYKYYLLSKVVLFDFEKKLCIEYIIIICYKFPLSTRVTTIISVRVVIDFVTGYRYIYACINTCTHSIIYLANGFS